MCQNERSCRQHNNFNHFQNDKFADNNCFKFNENGTKRSKRVKNTMGEGEIACYDVFKTCTADM